MSVEKRNAALSAFYAYVQQNYTQDIVQKCREVIEKRQAWGDPFDLHDVLEEVRAQSGKPLAHLNFHFNSD